ncbi:MAG: glycerophosphoryl diester phosphodiesterase [Gammaproteobacteria bacterium]|nr:glycerophosphoryl diester phosphodiesterase [Gammaproteobacteria bacterium]
MLTNKILQKPWLIAHRGASAFAPENTLPAMHLAKEKGAVRIEFDVVLSQDGVPLIFHDERLERTTNGEGWLSKKDAHELRILDAGHWFSADYKNTLIPTLTEWLQEAAHLELGINLEIKPLDDRIPLLVDRILEALEQEWSSHLPTPLVSSFSIEALSYLRERNQSLKLGLLLDEWREDWEAICDKLNCVTVNLNHECVTAARVQAIHDSGRAVLVYTVNDLDLAKRLFDLGVDGIFSNYPDLI